MNIVGFKKVEPNQPNSVSFGLNSKPSKSVVSSLATLPSVSTKPQFKYARFIDQSGIQTYVH